VRGTAPPAPKAFDAEKYLTTLDPEHESLKAIGLTAQTLREWKAGYKKGKLMAAIEGSAGFMAISLEDQTTTFPKDVDPRLYIFGGYRLQMGDVQLLRSPLDVLMASEHGITNCIAFLTEKISVEQLFYLSKFLEDRKLESIILMSGCGPATRRAFIPGPHKNSFLRILSGSFPAPCPNCGRMC